jgi:hypothetical protein
MIPRAAITFGRTVAATTDETGKWTIENLPCGKISLIPSRPTFLAGRAVPIELTAENPTRDVRLTLTPQAAITGRVVDEYGDPVVNMRVLSKRSLVVDGARQYEPVLAGVTNDIGEYRIAALPAGHYLVCAGEQCSPPLTIAAGYNGVMDFRLSPVASRRVSGTVSGVPEGARVQLTLSNDSITRAAPVGAEGEFEFTAPPGSYTLLATAFYGDDQLMAARQIIVGDRGVDGIALHLGTGLEVTGTVHIISQKKTEMDTSKLKVTLYHPNPTGPSSLARIIWNDGRDAFTARNIAAGVYHLAVSPPPGFHVDRITAGGADITDSEMRIDAGYPPIDILLSNGGGVLEGTAQPESGIVILRGNRHWSTRADAKGHFRADGIPPGDYQLSAWDDLTKVPFRDAAWMEVYAKAISATVTDSQSTSVTLDRSTAPDD